MKTTVLTGNHAKKMREQRGRAASEADQNLLVFKSNLALSRLQAKEAIAPGVSNATQEQNNTSVFKSLIGGLGATSA